MPPFTSGTLGAGSMFADCLCSAANRCALRGGAVAISPRSKRSVRMYQVCMLAPVPLRVATSQTYLSRSLQTLIPANTVGYTLGQAHKNARQT